MRVASILVLVIACSALSWLGSATVDSPGSINSTASILLLENPAGDKIGVLHAVEMAIEDVNRTPDVLPGYTLSLLCNSTEFEGTV